MLPLPMRLAAEVSAWRTNHYDVEHYPILADVLQWARGDEVNPRFLRDPQLRALETYWYLRLVRQTPHVLELYRQEFHSKPELLAALGLTHPTLKDLAIEFGVDDLLQRVRADDDLVRQFKLQALRETLSLDYPSYILALAMGAGKTILIGAILATEFALALEYPDGPFVQNALVFAPGKTIIESLRELLAAPYDRVLPPRLHKAFAASVKFTFTRDGEKDIPVVRGSCFNVVVTNTEKIRIQKETIRKSELGALLSGRRTDDARQELANLRLTAIASLPHLAVFSDEAHHTYGQSLDSELKKVRKTVDYLHQQTNVVCVVNTTGTPYFQKQPLRDVVIWYGLSEGIREGILKDVSDNIQAFDFDGDAARYVDHVVRDFFAAYGDVRLPDGAPAKLAIYFPQTEDLDLLRPSVDKALAAVGQSPAVVLVNTSDQTLTKPADIDAFNRLNDPRSPHRVVLLVNKGTEGWNCPSLFACALARKLRSSNNFVLQAATRCLRQVPGNSAKARIYLSNDNVSVLDQQLQETYGESIATLGKAATETRRARIVIRKHPIQPLVLRQRVRHVVRAGRTDGPLVITPPATEARTVTARRYTLGASLAGTRVLTPVGDTVSVDAPPAAAGLYEVATELAATSRLDPLAVKTALAAAYPDGEIPIDHIESLAAQVEQYTSQYSVVEETVERALALVRPEGFQRERQDDGTVTYTAEISYPVDRERYVVALKQLRVLNPRHLGFHLDPLVFDSNPEMSFFEQVLKELNVRPWDVEDMYFTGGLTDPGKTDFFVEYKDEAGQWRRYTPDFVIRKKPRPGSAPGSGRVLIVEVKDAGRRDHAVDGAHGRKAMAVRAWTTLNPEQLAYEIVFARAETVTYDQLRPVWTFAEAREVYLPVAYDEARLQEFCRRWRITRMDVFGSALRDDFGPESDLDFLVDFAPGAAPGLRFVHLVEELEGIVGRRVDVVTRASMERHANWVRRAEILGTARPLYVA
jgi:predicted nucleotidyltransferase